MKKYILLLPILPTILLFVFFNGCKEEKATLSIKYVDPQEAAQTAKEIRDQVSVTVAEGLELTLWASDSLAPDPIALDVDDLGNVYITRTNRQKNSEFDIRGHVDWMTASISLKSVEERRAFIKEVFSAENSEENSWLPDLNGDSIHDWRDLAVEKEEIYRLADQSGDGVADMAQLYTRDFNEEITDVAGALMAYEDNIYVGVGPDMWRLWDQNGDGMADKKESISHGYAVHVGFGGHGMSGLTVGPDGRIYWSIGDIGSNIVDKTGKVWANPNQGAIFRSNPDGTDFEVFARGLRNTHEFVFDEFGNLMSVDNDGDHPGESERMVYIVNGSDTGWRTNWQFGKYTDPDNNSYKVWMDEGLYKPRFEGQPAYITPPIRNYHNGPTGMLYNPGHALSSKYQNKYFVVEFTGSPARSNIWAYDLVPNGAGFDFGSEEKVLTGVLATGIDFGPDGAMYIGDWIQGWGTKNYGRVWKLDNPSEANSAERKQTEKLIKESFDGKSVNELTTLLAYEDKRIRQKAQFELAGRKGSGWDALAETAKQSDNQLARIHGLWGLWQTARKDPAQAEILPAFLNDNDPEIRAQAAKIIGDIRYASAGEQLIPLLKDESLRIRFFAAEALGRIAYEPAIQPIIQMLIENNDEDVYLRHAGSLALARIGKPEPVIALSSHDSRALRIAAVVALRRMTDPGVAEFLNDADEFIVTEAARAINDDLSIEEALPALARVLKDERFTAEPLIRRAINANMRVGEPENITILSDYATRNNAPAKLRAEAIATIGVWSKPSILDRVDGRLRGPVERDPKLVSEALEAISGEILGNQKTVISLAAIDAVSRLKISSISGTLHQMVSSSRDQRIRAAALDGLYKMQNPEIEKAIQTALADRKDSIRANALKLVPELSIPDERKADLLSSVLNTNSLKEQQIALATIGKMELNLAEPILGKLVLDLETGKLNPGIQLELFEAIESTNAVNLQTRIDDFRKGNSDQLLAGYGETLEGGQVDLGRQVLFRNQAAQCARCHAFGPYGGDVGPALTEVGLKLSKRELLESLVNPSAAIADGYGIVMLKLKNGEEISGIVERETVTELTFKDDGSGAKSILVSEIESRQNGPSSMPPMGAILSKREIRDMIAFLSELKGERAK